LAAQIIHPGAALRWQWRPWASRAGGSRAAAAFWARHRVLRARLSAPTTGRRATGRSTWSTQPVASCPWCW